MTQLEGLLRVNESLLKPSALTCARAFADDSISEWLIPDKEKRANMRYSFEVPLRLNTMGVGEAYTTSPECEGVAIWSLSSEKQSLRLAIQAGFPRLPLHCGWRYLLRDAAMMKFCDQLRREYAPPLHMYLGILAVAPEHHGKGIASRLLRPMLKHLDESTTACYLETQNLKNVEMYSHFGFEQVHAAELPGSGIRLYLMLRQPPSSG
jgi:ribosomal protein S18 acetylase RimI-like enzyme